MKHQLTFILKESQETQADDSPVTLIPSTETRL